MSKKAKIENQVDIAFNDLKRQFAREAPKSVHSQFTSSNRYYYQWSLKKILSRFVLDNAPQEWDINYFWMHLFLDGHVAILDTELGVIPLKCGYTGINVWDRPTDIIIANPILGSFERKIGENAALIHLQFDYGGITPILERFSTLLALCDAALSVNLMNSKVSFIGFVDSLSQANTMKAMYDKINDGEPAVFVRKDMVTPENFIFNNVRQTFVADDILLVRRKIVNDFLSDIGINNANIDKRERLNTEEVNANNDEMRFNICNWVDTISEGIEVANILYGLDLKVRIRDMESVKDEFTESNKLP